MSEPQYVYQTHGWQPVIIRHRLIRWAPCFVTYYHEDWKCERRARHKGEFFLTWQEARDAMVSKRWQALERCRESLTTLQNELEQLMALTEPT